MPQKLLQRLRRDMAAARFDAGASMAAALHETKRASLLFLFCSDIPDYISSLPHGLPVELAVIYQADRRIPKTAGTLRITQLKLG